MKKLICLVMSAVLLVGTATVASAEDIHESSSEAENYPLVIVRGMDFNGLYLDYGTANQRNAISDVSFSGVMKTLAKASFAFVKDKSLDSFTGEVLDYVDEIIGSMACDKNGNSLYNVSVGTYTKAVSEYPDLVSYINTGTDHECAIGRTAIDRYGADSVYFFNYDWRLDPLDTCDMLNSMIEQAKSDHDSDKVNLVCCSMGGVVTDAYVYEYGYDSLNKCIFNSSAFCGTYVATDLLQGKIKITGDGVYNYLNGLTEKNFFVGAAYKTGLFNAAANVAQKFVDREKDYVYDNFLRDTYCTMPGIWAIVQPESYESCMDYMFPTDELKQEYSGLIKRAEALHEMMSQMDSQLLEMKSSGVQVVVIASYGKGLAPVYESCDTQGDGILESSLMLGRAVTSDVGKTLGENYSAVDSSKVSPDNCVDLSGVLFPDSTWAIYDSPHISCIDGSDMSDFLFWVIDYEGQPTVSSNPKYPQFMKSGSDENLQLF